jgi:uncharacterized membrane protein HdeD (DUF308 family)
MEARAHVDAAALAKNWWIVALRGVAAVLFGVLAALVPGITLFALVLLFGTYALIDGGFAIIAASRRRGGGGPWWALLFEGLVSIAAGIVAFVLPGLTALALIYVICVWAIFTGVLEIVAAIRLRRQIQGEWWLALTGVLSIAFGGLVLLAPGAGALALVLWIGAYSIVFGILLIALAFRLRGMRDEIPLAAPHAA